MRKTFVIGDIHGCYRSLLELLRKIDPIPKQDLLVFLGDYVDRGPDSMQVVAELLKLQKQCDHVIFLKGNHEQVFLNYLSGKDRDFYLLIGGRETAASYGINDPLTENPLAKIPPEHVSFFDELLPYWEDDSYIYVHAGIQPGVHLTQQTPDWLFWGRGGKFADLKYDFGKQVVYGHTVCRPPIVEVNKIGIDTGAVYGGDLTCLILPDMEFVSVRGRNYWPVEL